MWLLSTPSRPRGKAWCGECVPARVLSPMRSGGWLVLRARAVTPLRGAIPITHIRACDRDEQSRRRGAHSCRIVVVTKAAPRVAGRIHPRNDGSPGRTGDDKRCAWERIVVRGPSPSVRSPRADECRNGRGRGGGHAWRGGSRRTCVRSRASFLDLRLDTGLCYIITSCRMTHHHHAGHLHPPARISPSLLRASAGQRLAAAAVCIALLWLAVIWAL